MVMTPLKTQFQRISWKKRMDTRSVTYEENNSDKLKLSELPAISLSEADHILSVLRKHTDAQEELDIQMPPKENKHGLEL